MSEERKQKIKEIVEIVKKLDCTDLMIVSHTANALHTSELVHKSEEAVNHG